MNVFPRFNRIALLSGLVVVSAWALSACYVVPVQSTPSTVIQVPAPQPQTPVTFTARLYPDNAAASNFGMVNAVVTNDLNGRGHFSANINGESFTGEATRMAGSPRDGVANGAGSRGNFIQCRFSMNSATQGTGRCTHSEGAVFTMHLGG